MRYGGYRGTDNKHILNWKELKQLKPTEKIGGGWIVQHCAKQSIPRRKDHLLIVTLIDKSNGNHESIDDPITARIWHCPPSQTTIPSDSLLVISPQKACIKEFNSSHQIHVDFKQTQIVLPHQVKTYKRQNSLSPSPKKQTQIVLPHQVKPYKRQNSSSPSPKKQQKPKRSLQKTQTITFSDLSSLESTDISNDTQPPQHGNIGSIQYDANHRKHYPPNPMQTEQEQLQSSLGIDDSVVIAHDEKVIYNYAAQQVQQKQSDLNINISSNEDNNKSMSPSISRSPSRKRSFTEMNGYNGDDEHNEEKEDIGNNEENEPSPKKQKLLNEKSPSPSPSTELTSYQRQQIEDKRLAAIERLKLHRMNTDIPRIYVVDLETTSFPPDVTCVANGDVIIEIAIVQFNRTEKQLYAIKPVLHCFIDPETYDEYPANWKESWIFKKGTAVDMVKQCGLDAKVILSQIRKILNGEFVTSYNTEFDLKRFLSHPPYNIECREFECIMKMCGKAMNIINPSLEQAAHEWLGMDFRWGLHNAMEDALTAAKIFSQVVKN